jgi:hypothetical protein
MESSVESRGDCEGIGSGSHPAVVPTDETLSRIKSGGGRLALNSWNLGKAPFSVSTRSFAGMTGRVSRDDPRGKSLLPLHICRLLFSLRGHFQNFHRFAPATVGHPSRLLDRGIGRPSIGDTCGSVHIDRLSRYREGCRLDRDRSDRPFGEMEKSGNPSTSVSARSHILRWLNPNLARAYLPLRSWLANGRQMRKRRPTGLD